MGAELHPVLMSLGAVGFAGICKALLMVLFTVAILLLFLFMGSLTPSPLEASSMRRAPARRVGLLRSACSGKLSLSLNGLLF